MKIIIKGDPFTLGKNYTLSYYPLQRQKALQQFCLIQSVTP